MKEKFLNFYSKNKIVVWIVGAVLVVGLALILMGGNNNQNKWNEILLKDYVPQVTKGNLNVTTNENSNLSMGIDNVDTKYYNEYKDECIKMGYTIDSKDQEKEYQAYNKDGYKVRAYIISSKMYVELTAPENYVDISWPTSGIGALLPTPNSTSGKIISDSSNYFHIKLGEFSREDYTNYVKACEDKGFTNDYEKKDNYYSAKNSDNYKAKIEYLGGNNVDIYIEAPKTDNSSTNTDNSGSNTSGEMRSEFKTAMDSYENFMDEYVTFMKKYKANPTDPGLLSSYTDYLTKYSQFVSDFEKWNSKDLNTKEATYYAEVQSRVAKKLIEVAS